MKPKKLSVQRQFLYGVVPMILSLSAGNLWNLLGRTIQGRDHPGELALDRWLHGQAVRME